MNPTHAFSAVPDRPAAPLPAPGPEPDSFESRAREILGGREPVTAGKLHLVSFAKIKERFGDQWPQVAPKAEELMRRAVERRLQPVDVYRKGAELDFVLLFPELTPQEGRLKCAQIAEEITRALVADLGADVAQIDAGAAVVDSKSMLAVIQRDGDLAEAISGEIAKVTTVSSKEDNSAALDHVRFLFRPIWDVKRNAVFNFFCVPMVKTQGGRIQAGEAAIDGLADRKFRLDYDLRLLKRVVDELMRVGAQDRRLLFTSPVHVDTVSFGPFRTEYLRVWRELPLSLQRLAVFDLVGGSEGFPQSRLIEILPSLKPVSRAVTLRMPVSAVQSIGRFAHVGLHALSTEAISNREEGAQAEFEKFVVATEKAHLLTYLHGIRTGSLALAAVGAGFSFIDGPAIGSAEVNPKDALRFSMEDLDAGR